MRLIWFRTCNKYGAKTQPTLMYWNEDAKLWEDIPSAEVKKDDEAEALSDPDLYWKLGN